MNVCAPFIRRRVMTTLVMAAILLFGAMAYRRLPVSDLPTVDFPTISVTAALPGANPETMASSVAQPLEKEFSTIAGVDNMTSTSLLGNASITLQFALERDIDAAAQDVQAAIARAGRNLPRDMPSPPSYRKVNPADSPILFVALTSPTLPLYELNRYAETTIAQRISTVLGVAQVQVYGGQKYAVRVRLDPRELATRGIGIDEVQRAVQDANVNLPTGVLLGPERSYTVQAGGQLTTAEAYGPIIIAYRGGKPVRLAELGRVYDSVENDRVAAWYIDRRAGIDQRGIILAVQRQPGTNTVEVARRVKELLDVFREQLPASVSLRILFDRSQSIQESVRDVKTTLLVTLILVVLVIFLFIRNLSATLIPSLAMPMSIVGTFSVMYLLGYSVDNLSLMALTLSVGFVVDDAIVMLENIVRHMEMGKTRLQAAFDGSAEIAFTIVSMTISLAAVFIPVLFMGGIIGRLFQEFAVVVGIAVLISGFVSLTLTPLLGSRFLYPAGKGRYRALYDLFERFFTGMRDVYGVGLRWSIAHRRVVLALMFALTALTAVLFVAVPKGFVPSQDIGQLFGQTEGTEGVSFDAMVTHQKAVAAVIKSDPGIEAFMSSAGGRGGMGAANTGSLFIRLTPRGRRDVSADEIVERLRPRLAQIPGIRAFIQSPPALQIGGRMSRSLYQVTLHGLDTEALYRVAPVLEERLGTLPELTDVSTDLLLKNPELKFAINRDKVAALDVTVQQIEEALYTAYGQRQISTIYAPEDQYRVVMELAPEYQREVQDLRLLYIRSARGELVPLDSLVTFGPGVGPVSVNHTGQVPSVTLSFNLARGVALSHATEAVKKAAADILPETISMSFQGTAEAFETAQRGLGLLLLLAILVIYMVLGILYESFAHPLTILSALPLAGAGAVGTLLIFGCDLNIYSFVGVIMLVGLVKKNGIIMIDFAIEARRTRGMAPAEAIVEACLVRFRPIMMTTMAALLGTLPIALGFGAGGETRQPLGLAVVGGLLVSQSLTLFATPVVYVYMEKLTAFLVGSKASGTAGS